MSFGRANPNSAPTSFLRALQATGTVAVLPDTPTPGAIAIDYNNESRAGMFSGNDVFFEITLPMPIPFTPMTATQGLHRS
jgi:hypothetical protein